MKKLVYLVGEDRAFLTHRLNLAREAKKNGFEVHVITKITEHEREIIREGFRIHKLVHFSRGGMNPFKDFLFLKELYALYKSLKPDIVHHVAWKPVLYGSFIARLTGVPRIINALTGMGYLFISNSPKVRIVRCFLRLILKRILSPMHHVMIVQNPEDKQLVRDYFGFPASKIRLIRGSGVDPKKFKPVKIPPGRLKFVCISRLLWDKGIRELIEAIRIAKLTHASFDVILCGDIDPYNPASIPLEKIQEWARQGLINWKGHVRDVASIYNQAHVAILPSYREGLPKALLEGASCGLPIITTDAPGCREVVANNLNGILVPVKDARKLAEAICYLIDNPQRRQEFGKASRDRVLKYFSDPVIIEKTLKLYGK